MELTRKCQALENRQENLPSTYIPLHRQDQANTFEYDRDVLSAFYDYYKRPGDDQLSYWQIDEYKFESEAERRCFKILLFKPTG